jgi:hypothetical protein
MDAVADRTYSAVVLHVGCQYRASEKAPTSTRCRGSWGRRVPWAVGNRSSFNATGGDGDLHRRLERALGRLNRARAPSERTLTRASGQWRRDEICQEGRSWTSVGTPAPGRLSQSGQPFPLRASQISRKKRKGGDSNPRDRSTRPNGFQDRRIQPLCHPSEASAMLRVGRQVLHWPPAQGEVAEWLKALAC